MHTAGKVRKSSEIFASIELLQRKPRQTKPEREDATNAPNATFMSEKALLKARVLYKNPKGRGPGRLPRILVTAVDSAPSSSRSICRRAKARSPGVASWRVILWSPVPVKLGLICLMSKYS